MKKTSNAKASEGTVTRREVLAIAQRYGVVSTVMASAGMLGAVSAPRLAAAAESVYNKRYSTDPVVTLRYGAAGYTRAIEEVQKTGVFHFINELETRTDGAVRVEYFPGGQVCNQLDCVKKAQQGIVDIFTASSQNSAAAAPYYNAIDFPFMFPSRGAMHYFFYHPGSEKIFRKPLRERHGLEFLFGNCELRAIYLGLKFEDNPLIDNIEALNGAKIRATGSLMGQTALRLMGMSPVPVAWEETLEGLKSGLIDGAETSASAAAYAGMTPVIAQALEIDFFANCEHVALSTASWEKLGSDYQEHALEAAYAAEVFSHGMNEAALLSIVGNVPNPPADTYFGRDNVRVSVFGKAEVEAMKQMCTPEHQPDAWSSWRDRLGKWAGGIDVYEEIRSIVAEIPEGTKTVNVEPRRWWRA